MSFQEILTRNGFEVQEWQDAEGVSVLTVKKEELSGICQILKNERNCAFDMLLAVIGLDCETHFEVLYSFCSTKNNTKLLVKTVLSKENPCVESLCGLYNSANWHERECFDLLGIEFLNHPKLERILMPKDWIGHPLRKDYKEEDERLVWNRR